MQLGLVSRHSKPKGFTYLGVLIAIAILALGLSSAAEVWMTVSHREKLAELDWIGEQFTVAIAEYYNGTPGVVVKVYPPDLQSLLLDRRFIFVRRYLRRIYANPFTKKQDWAVISAPGGGICGVDARVVVGDQIIERRYVFSPRH